MKKEKKNERKKDVQPESMKELMFFSPGGINHSIATGVDI